MYYTYKNFNFNDVAISVIKVKILYILLYILIFIPLITLVSFKFILLIKNYKNINQKKSIKINLISSFYNIFLPAKLGDITRIFYSNIKKKDYLDCIAIMFYEKTISLISISLIVFLSSSLIIEYFFEMFFLIVLFFILTFKFNYLIAATNYFIKMLNFKNIYLSKKSNKTIRDNFHLFFLIDTIVWLIIFLQIFFISQGLDLDLTYTKILYIFGLSIIIGVIPVSFGGFGVRDIFIFEALKNQIENSDILTLLIFFNLRYLIPGIIGYIIKVSEYNNR